MGDSALVCSNGCDSGACIRNDVGDFRNGGGGGGNRVSACDFHCGGGGPGWGGSGNLG